MAKLVDTERVFVEARDGRRHDPATRREHQRVKREHGRIASFPDQLQDTSLRVDLVHLRPAKANLGRREQRTEFDRHVRRIVLVEAWPQGQPGFGRSDDYLGFVGRDPMHVS